MASEICTRGPKHSFRDPSAFAVGFDEIQENSGDYQYRTNNHRDRTIACIKFFVNTFFLVRSIFINYPYFIAKMSIHMLVSSGLFGIIYVVNKNL